jgi:hypothetical protein
MAGSAPSYDVSPINGNMALNFKDSLGIAKYLYSDPLVNPPFIPANNTVFIVSLSESYNFGSPATFLRFYYQGQGDYLEHQLKPGNQYALGKHDVELTSNYTNPSPTIAVSRFNQYKSFAQFFINGKVMQKSNQVGAFFMSYYNQFSIGCGQLMSNCLSFDPSNHYIAEIIVYNAVLSDEERIGIDKYLAQKYNISIDIEPVESWE